jgi:hypothetical protein
MDICKAKKIGTREEVFKGLAERTAGSLKKDDIIEKSIGNHKIYISKKLSDRMKLNIATLRINNPNFFKRLQKKTMVNTNENTTNENTTNENTTNENTTNVNTTNPTNPIVKSNVTNKTNILHKHNNNNNKTKLHPKTQKLAFKVKDNAFKTIYYPELQGINIKELKEELVREEAEEDLNYTSQENKIKNEPFKIEDMPDINMNELE